MEEARALQIEERRKQVTVYVPGERGGWTVACKKPKRPLHSLCTRDNQLEDLKIDMQLFLDGKEWYMERGLPYR